MNVVERLMIAIVLTGIVMCAAVGKEKYTWQPVTRADWDVHAGSRDNEAPAIIIFNQETGDDRKLSDKDVYHSVYTRIRILRNEGKHWGDVSVPYDPEKENVEEVEGRVLLPDGQEQALNENDIQKKEVFKTSDTRMKQLSFSLPGITDNCIIEYYYRFHQNHPNYLWVFQKDIPVLHCEYQWYISQDQDRTINLGYGRVMTQHQLANYVSVNFENSGTIDFIPNKENPERAVFSFGNLSAFHTESMTLPDRSFRGQLSFYYASNSTSDQFWSSVSYSEQRLLDQFVNDTLSIKKIIAPIETLKTTEEKVNAAYIWVQSNIANTLNGDMDMKRKENKNIQDVLDRKYGTSEDINTCFYAMLTGMHIPTGKIFVSDRSVHVFYPVMKYWQFDGSLVFARMGSDSVALYDPGVALLPPEQTPWYVESGAGLIVSNSENKLFMNIPASSASVNSMTTNALLSLNGEGFVSGTFDITVSGQRAWQYRLLSHDQKVVDRQDMVAAKLQDEFLAEDIDSLTFSALDSSALPLRMRANVKLSHVREGLDNKLYLQPVSLMSNMRNPFFSEVRTQPIVFPFAYEYIDSLTIRLPDRYTIEAMAENSHFHNTIGSYDLTFQHTDSIIVMKYARRLTRAISSKVLYAEYKDLFTRLQDLENLVIVLNPLSNQ